MIEPKERHLDVTMCHRSLMRHHAELSLVETQEDMVENRSVTWLDDGAYAVIPEISPQICQIVSIGHDHMTIVYFSDKPLTQGSLSSAEIVVLGSGFLADHLPVRVENDRAFDDENGSKRVCVMAFPGLSETSKAQIDDVIELKGRPLQ